MTGLRRLAMPRGPAVLSVIGDLEKALDGGDAVQPVSDEVLSPAGVGPDTIADGVAVVVATSGSTGTAKRAILTAASLIASASSTHEVLGGSGRWLLAMPAHHVAGLQVLVRSVVAGTTPEVLDLDGGFDVGRFAETSERLVQGTGRR